MAALGKEMGSDPVSGRTNYLGIRHSHFRTTLRDWLRGLDKALIAIASALTFILTAMVAMVIFGMAQALLLLLDPATSAAHLLFVAKHLERIGDYVKDICELNVYLGEAVFIKHSRSV